tara:strand:+ start:9663 stop:10037 length:375 start_codon:yes stop_codon:yes gene_type:complete
MATITTRLLITGDAVTSDPIAVDYSQPTTVTAPAIESASVDVTNAGVEIVTGTAAPSTRTFVYVKCTNSASQISPLIIGLTGAADAMILYRDEFLYIPIKPGQIVTLDVASDYTAQAEYGFFSA